jgi:ATP-dependent exoDNAse (exonuclease V) beta subunit
MASPGVAALETAVDRLFAAPDPASDDRLQIMTIHKAKGLEFDTVIIPSLDRITRRFEPELIRWQERLTSTGARELIMAPMPPKGGDKDSIYNFLQEEQRKKEAYETCRLMYVACTRARHSLYLLTGLGLDVNNSLRTPLKGSLLHTVWDSIQGELERIDTRQTAPPAGGEAPPAPQLRRLPGAWRMPALAERDLLSGRLDPPAAAADTITGEDDVDDNAVPGLDATARHIGTVVHATMQEIGRGGLAGWDDARLDLCMPFWQARLATLGVPAAALDGALAEVRDILLAVLRDAGFRRFFTDPGAVRYCEHAITVPVRRGYRNLVIDLLLQEPGGDTWVVDYKTGRPGPGEDPDAFVAQRMRLHEKKMTLYRTAAMRLGYTRVRTALYFPVLSRWCMYDAD